MTRELIPYFNMSADGVGLEGLLNWTNGITDNWFVPIFLLVFYGLAIFLASKSEYKMGAWVGWISFLFALLGAIAQTFTQFNQMVIFIFVIGIAVGVVMSFIENAKT